MSRTGQTIPVNLNGRPIATLAAEYAAGEVIDWHRHDMAQLVFAASGLMRVAQAGGHWVVPARRAVWIPGGLLHSITCIDAVAARMVYVAPDAAPWLPHSCGVLPPSTLLCELVTAAMALAPNYPPNGREARLVAVLLDQLDTVPSAELHLPVPREPRLRRIAEGLADDPADRRGLGAWARDVGASERTLARLFQAETGMGFRAWRQQLRFHEALARLAAGEAVTAVALTVGYDSPSAFIARFRRVMGQTPRRYVAAVSPADGSLD